MCVFHCIAATGAARGGSSDRASLCGALRAVAFRSPCEGRVARDRREPVFVYNSLCAGRIFVARVAFSLWLVRGTAIGPKSRVRACLLSGAPDLCCDLDGIHPCDCYGRVLSRSSPCVMP
jgi:hypothetical protein